MFWITNLYQLLVVLGRPLNLLFCVKCSLLLITFIVTNWIIFVHIAFHLPVVWFLLPVLCRFLVTILKSVLFKQIFLRFLTVCVVSHWWLIKIKLNIKSPNLASLYSHGFFHTSIIENSVLELIVYIFITAMFPRVFLKMVFCHQKYLLFLIIVRDI